MIIVTSLSPNHTHAENQQTAIDSWQGIAKVYSLNSWDEWKLLVGVYKGVTLETTRATIGHLVGKHLVTIYAAMQFPSKDDILLVNSDIIIKGLPELKQDGITIFSRYDYTDDIEKATKFINGFDMFYIPGKFHHLFPFSIYALGACWHDYFTPMIAINNNVPLYSYNQAICFHKLHPVQYPMQDYFDIGEVFRWEFKLPKKMLIPQVAAMTLAKINSYIIWL